MMPLTCLQRVNPKANVTVDWMAYQGAPVGGVAGEVRISQWWTGTTCKAVNFPSVSHSCFKLDSANFTSTLNYCIMLFFKLILGLTQSELLARNLCFRYF